MATVFPNRQAIHVWAQQSQPSGRSNNGNLSFEGDTLFSYSTPIARIVTGRKGVKVMLVTDATYSVTTSSRHMPRDSDFAGPFFRVPSLGAGRYGGRHREPPGTEPGKINHRVNIGSLVAAYTTQVASEKRGRGALEDWRREYLPKHLARLAGDVDSYATAFGFKPPRLDAAADFEAIVQHRAERNARNNTPAAIAKREREAQRRREREERIEADRVGAWRRGELDTLRQYGRRGYGRRGYTHTGLENGGALLRIRGDNLETSLGASVPIAHAVRAFRFIKLVRERGQPWERNGHTVRVGHFSVDRIDIEGNINAGCHRINWPEIERMAVALDVLNAAPSDEATESTSA